MYSQVLILSTLYWTLVAMLAERNVDLCLAQVLGNFQFWDYNVLDDLPETLRNSFQVVAVDPPYLVRPHSRLGQDVSIMEDVMSVYYSCSISKAAVTSVIADWKFPVLKSYVKDSMAFFTYMFSN